MLFFLFYLPTPAQRNALNKCLFLNAPLPLHLPSQGKKNDAPKNPIRTFPAKSLPNPSLYKIDPENSHNTSFNQVLTGRFASKVFNSSRWTWVQMIGVFKKCMGSCKRLGML
ncbi:hypothetical protein MRB53_032253 [Persea americana]|uniref:Uncharacterized protein n=1 Tax=Persea americana TaxID=3435 RepID=A0ACC2KS29_PERAE|nr:hypothetical protein MRB53_032253 [Persea americana]|eukprot:TRINITY_DN3852_c1_g1_i3.p1 TRINITY_DN3852_c1_g1~~TRINITY_DN3852_c1_g1_i3.p1  ORF type:complete len:112 (+),score=13.51 TRINITY_DN3852_c1_g1_i3:213-548(+)